jgi:biopolymer transport protein ExbD
MIDVVFLLLIFFMCASRFRSLERRLDAELPRDGQNLGPPPDLVPNELRVQLFWANSRRDAAWPFGQCIHSPRRAFPEGWREMDRRVRGDVTTDGAHLVCTVNRKRRVEDAAGSGDPDWNELARILSDFVVRDPGQKVVIDARQAVPFRAVVGALDACKRARVANVRFQAPPVEEGGGDDWWWM